MCLTVVKRFASVVLTVEIADNQVWSKARNRLKNLISVCGTMDLHSHVGEDAGLQVVILRMSIHPKKARSGNGWRIPGRMYDGAASIGRIKIR